MLKPITTGLWEHDHPFRVLGIIELGHRMTVIRLDDGGLVLHSPTPLDEKLEPELAGLGPVRFVLAPNTNHNLFLEPYAERYPDARFLAVPGFREKYPKLRGDALLDTSSRELPEGVFGVRTIDGMPAINEAAVLHRPTGTLIVADLVFNFGRDVPLATGLLLRAVGAYGGVGASRLFRSFIKNREAFRQSLDEVLAWDFDRIVVGHGRVVETGGKKALREAYARYNMAST